MIRQISIKTKFGWITAFEEKGKIIKVKFGKSRNILPSKNLKRLKQSFNNFFDRKSKSIKFKYSLNGTSIQKKIWRAGSLFWTLCKNTQTHFK